MNSEQERPPVNLEREVLDWCDAVYAEAEDELSTSPEFKMTSKLIDYIHGRQWSASSRFGRSRPVKNRVFRQFIETVGLLTDIQPDFQVNIHDKIEGHSELQDLLNKMITAWATLSDFEGELQQVAAYGLLHTGYAKVQWDSTQLDGIGDNLFRHLSPMNVMKVGTTGKLHDAECIIVRTPVTIAWLQRKYGPIADGIRPDLSVFEAPGTAMRPSSVSKNSWTKLSPALRRLIGQKNQGVISKYPQVMLKEFWLKDDSVWKGSESIRVGRKGTNWSYIVEPGMPLYPRGRVIMTAADRVLEDTCNPYWHSKAPISVYRPFRVPWQFEGASMMEPIVAMQNVINRIYGGVMDTVQQAIEPSIIAPKGALSQSGWDALDPGAVGQKIAYNNNSPQPPTWRKPPELANYVMTVVQNFEQEQDLTSGAAVMNQLAQKKQVPGGDSLDQIMNSRSTNIRLAGRALQAFLTECGQMAVSNYLQFADSRHRIARFGSDGLTAMDFEPLYGNMLPRGMKPESFVNKVQFTIRKGSLLTIEQQDKLQIAFGLRKAGDLSRRGLYRIMDANVDIKQIEAELKEEMAEKAAIAAAAGALNPKGHH